MEFDLPAGTTSRRTGGWCGWPRRRKDKYPGMGLEFVDLVPRIAPLSSGSPRRERTMAETLEELSYNYEDEGTLVRKELDRAVLTKGSWATIMFLFQELDRAKGKFRAPKMAIVRFKKSKGSYRKQSSFNISNEKQARQITEVFERWYSEDRRSDRRGRCGGQRRTTEEADDSGADDDDRGRHQSALAGEPKNPRIATEFQSSSARTGGSSRPSLSTS